ncbi:MAG: sensor domain-containing protein, partial [Chloroflexi bacterium]|nr:sensor domain-containing protein [Chloroflexota bacterium]
MTDAFAAAYPARWSWRAKLLLPAVHPMTLVRAIHLGLMFPLGIASFVFLVVTLAVGGSLIWTLIGPIVLLLGLYISRWFGDLEAWRVRHVAGIELRRPPTGIERGQSFRQQVKTRLIDPSTWTGLIYLLIQFPIGIVAFVWLVVLGAVAGALMAAPLLVQFSEPSSGIQIMIDFGFWSTNLTKQGEIALALVPVGVLVYFVLVHSIYIGTAVHASWARLMLGSRAEPIALGPAERPEPPPPPTTGIDMPADEEAPVAALASGEESDPAAPALEDEVAAPEVPAAAPEIPAAPLEPAAPDP